MTEEYCIDKTKMNFPICSKIISTTSPVFTFQMQRFTFKMVKPGLLSPVMLNTIQMFLPVVHVVLKGPVTVVTEVSLAHGASYIFQPGMRPTLYLCGTENRRKSAFHELP